MSPRSSRKRSRPPRSGCPGQGHDRAPALARQPTRPRRQSKVRARVKQVFHRSGTRNGSRLRSGIGRSICSSSFHSQPVTDELANADNPAAFDDGQRHMGAPAVISDDHQAVFGSAFDRTDIATGNRRSHSAPFKLYLLHLQACSRSTARVRTDALPVPEASPVWPVSSTPELPSGSVAPSPAARLANCAASCPA